MAHREVVLVGVGHTNAHVLRQWRARPIPGARLTCVSTHPVATYSGLLPAVLAGQVPVSAMTIDIGGLCAAAGATLVQDEATGLDAAAGRLTCRSGAALPFDVLSIGIGSVPSAGGVDAGAGGRLLPIKPMQTFLPRLDARLRDAARQPSGVRIAVVGGGFGGTELALCLRPRVERVAGGAAATVTLVSDEEPCAREAARATVRRIRSALARNRVDVRAGHAVVAVNDTGLTLADGSIIEAGIVIWATGAAPPPLLADLGLPTDARGFLLTDRTLRSTSGAPIFAVGDAGAIAGEAIPKAGVYAVRQGPILWDNIQRLLAGRPLRAFAPQRSFLKLLNTGDGGAIGEWHGVSFEGAWVGRLKHAIDRRFMAQFAVGET